MRKTALLLCLVTASLFGSEVRTDQPLAPVQYGAAPPKQESAHIASDGTNFFVVWRTRTASNAIVLGAGRLSPAGELLDRPNAFLATGSEFTLGEPDVVFVGGNFLVVYQSGTSLVTRRFSREGHPVDSQPVVINNTGMAARLATDGKTVFLVTQRNRFRLLAPDGTPIGGQHDIPNAGNGTPSVASNGDRYLVAYAENADQVSNGLVVLLSGSGEYLGSHALPLKVTPYQHAVAAASDGSSFLVAMAGSGPVSCLRVDADGNPGVVRTLDGISGSGTAATGHVFVSWSGSEYTLTWIRWIYVAGALPQYGVVGARVDGTGTPLDLNPVTITPPEAGRYAWLLGMASNGRETITISGDADENNNDLHMSAAIFKSLPQIEAEPANRRHAAIASSAVEQASGSIASNGTLSLVAWRETSGLDQAVIRAAFIAADGEIGAPIDLGDAHAQTPTATVSNGRDFLVAYVNSESRLVARRVTLDGVLDSTPVLLTDFGFVMNAIAIGWSGQAYVIATTGERVVTVLGVAPDLTVLSSRQVIQTKAPADTPAVSCATAGCSVTWHWVTPFCGFPACYYAENDLYARTDPAGNVVSQVSLTDIPVTPALSFPASDGKFVFVYSSGTSMFAGRITAAGVVLDTPAVNGGRRVMTSETSHALQPVAVVNGSLYFIEPADFSSGRLYWTRVEPEPTPHVMTIVDLHQSVTFPLTLAASARNTYFLYSRGEDDATLMAPRLFLRTLASPDPQTSPLRRHAAR